MITVMMIESNQQTDLSAKVRSKIEIDEKLDTSLDSGTLSYLAKELDSAELREALAGYFISTSGAGFEFVGIDSRALLRRESLTQGIYSHQVELTEPTKLLQGVLIDGAAVAQPEEISERQSLYDVVVRLLSITPILKTVPLSRNEFHLTTDSNVVNVLKQTISPEFKWNTQTSLFECLLQVGAVVDAIPKLTVSSSGNFPIVTFEFVNAYDKEAEVLEGLDVNASGTNIDEGQYNSSLSSIVENLRENE